MVHFGVSCLPGRGHLYPAVALARELKQRGHSVTIFSHKIAQGFVGHSGISFVSIQPRTGGYTLRGNQYHAADGMLSTPEVMLNHVEAMSDSVQLMIYSRLNALLVDQADMIGTSIAEYLGIPAITISFFSPVYVDEAIPPFTVRWQASRGTFARRRFKEANADLLAAISPVLRHVDLFRRRQALLPVANVNEYSSSAAVVTQMPAALELPSLCMPPHIHYTGPFTLSDQRRSCSFPWHQLSRNGIVYVSLGTVRNADARLFEIIARSASQLPVQFVISLGGGLLMPEDLPAFKNCMLVHYAPQRELLQQASLVIFHGGMNTCLEAIYSSVPMLALPVADDQPGVAARIKAHGLGAWLSPSHLSSQAIVRKAATLLESPSYRQSVARIRALMITGGGVHRATDIIEAAAARG